MSQRSGPVAGAPGQGRGTVPFAEAPDGGLSSAEAAARLARYGSNELPRARRTPLWRMIAGQVRDPLVIQWLYDQTREVPGDAGKPRLQ
jgi:Ca2+-transporting ATPase